MIEKTLILTKKKTKNLAQEDILTGKEGADQEQDLNQNYPYPRQEVQVEIPVAEVRLVVGKQNRGKGNRVDMVYRVEFPVEERPEVPVKKHLSENLLSVPLNINEEETNNLCQEEDLRSKISV